MNESEYFDPNCSGEPYEPVDNGYGTCPTCESFLENWGAESSGDADIYDVIGCSICEEEIRHANTKWVDAKGNSFDSEDEYHWMGEFDNE